ncbi:MAG: hypothetical protein AAF351_14870 [Pseudomonadota bacterium]
MTILKSKAINSWGLFWLVSLSMSALMVWEMWSTDVSSPPGVSAMIGYSVRFAVPIIFLVVATSALQYLTPSALTRWLMRNRKYIGLCFAVAMAWQGFFIFLMSSFHSDYYYDEIFYFRDELEGSTGYLFLTAMVITSFRWGRKWLNPQQWRLIHLSGLYFLWAYPFSTYWWTLSYYGNPLVHDYLFYWLGFTAFALRIVAWGKKRLTEQSTPLAQQVLGGALVGLGLYWSAGSLYYQDAVTTLLTTYSWSANLELWLPFWPFEPFLSLFLMAVGTWFITRTSQRATVRSQAHA